MDTSPVTDAAPHTPFDSRGVVRGGSQQMPSSLSSPEPFLMSPESRMGGHLYLPSRRPISSPSQTTPPAKTSGTAPGTSLRQRSEQQASLPIPASLRSSDAYQVICKDVLQLQQANRPPSDAAVLCVELCGTNVWCAEGSGDIAVRSDRTTKRIATISKSLLSPNPIQVLCLVAFRDAYVWGGCSDGRIAVFDNANGFEKVKEMYQHCAGVSCMARGDTSIFSGSQDFTIIQWDAVFYQRLRTLAGHTNGVRCLRVLGNQLWSGADDASLRVWCIESGRCQSRLTAEQGGHVGSVLALTDAAGCVWSGSEDRSVRVWQCAGRDGPELLKVLVAHTSRVCSLLQVGSTVWSASSDCTVVVWDAGTAGFARLHVIEAHPGHVMQLALVSRGHAYDLWSVGSDRSLRVWQATEFGETATTCAPHDALGSRESALLAQNEALQEKNIALCEDVTQLTVQSQEANHLRSDLAIVQGAYDRLTAESEQMKWRLRSAEDTVERLTAELGRVEEAAQKERLQLLNQLSDLGGGFRTAQTQGETSKCAGSSADEVARLEAEHAEALHSLAIALAEKEDLEEELQRRGNRVDALSKELHEVRSDLEAQNDELVARLDEVERELAAYRGEAERNAEEMVQTSAQSDALFAELKVLRDQEREHAVTVATQRYENEVLQKELEIAQKETQLVRQTAQQLAGEKQQLENRWLEAVEDARVLKAEVTELQAEVHAYESDAGKDQMTDDMVQTNTALREECDRVCDRNQDLELRVQELESQIERMRQDGSGGVGGGEIAQLSRQNAVLQEQLAKALDHIEDLENFQRTLQLKNPAGATTTPQSRASPPRVSMRASPNFSAVSGFSTEAEWDEIEVSRSLSVLQSVGPKSPKQNVFVNTTPAALERRNVKD
eukprot:NODE_184_length_2839_cov_31.510036_g167_i0.p1 GENE.NODE_184_length_2839_cov_31.510036_g167_i0~~NODE_184_length_2839_cov_31.510036_g167_i0.p1  ORF type:complete len:894 (-),score=200.34 NODE_184_length_2839_cov_31.510036_g167_i0:45-2726(-)